MCSINAREDMTLSGIIVRHGRDGEWAVVFVPVQHKLAWRPRSSVTLT
jgi:hypothetical protein